MIRVYYTRLEPLLNDNIYEGLRRLIPSSFLHRVDRYKQKKAKALSLAAYSCLWAALVDGGYIPEDLFVTTAKKGKPYFKDSTVHFSLSHSGTWAAAALSCDNIGVDIECISDFKESVCYRFFSPDEASFVLKERDKQRAKCNFFKLWTLKEAYSKLSGEGIGGFGDFEILFGKTPALNHKNKLSSACFKEFAAYDFCGAVAYEGEEKEFDIKEINLIKLLIK